MNTTKKTIFITVTAFISLLFSACGSTELLLDSTYTQEMSNDSLSQNPDGNGKFEMYQVPMFGCGAGLIQKDENGSITSISPEALKVSDGKLITYFLYDPTIPQIDGKDIYDPKKDEVDITVLISINGKLCDFTLDGKESENGILYMRHSIGDQILSPVEISDFSALKGENKICSYVIVEHVGTPFFHPYQLGSDGSFYSDYAYKKESTIDAATKSNSLELNAETTEKLTGKKPVTINGSSTRVFYPYDEEINEPGVGTVCKTYINENTPLYFEIPNNSEHSGAINRSGFIIAIKDGKPCPAWDDKPLLLFELKRTDSYLPVSLTPKFHSGETTNFSCYYFETQSDTYESGESNLVSTVFNNLFVVK